jgi:hypothetical protein
MFFVFFVFVVIGIVFVASLVLYSTWYNMPGGHAEVAPIGNLYLIFDSLALKKLARSLSTVP